MAGTGRLEVAARKGKTWDEFCGVVEEKFGIGK